MTKESYWHIDYFESTAHNWQKWKRVFLTCSCHRIYRVEAVGLKTSNYTWKIMIFVDICKIWGNFVKNWYFVNNCLIKVQILKYYCNYLTHTTFRFYIISFQVKIDFPSQFCIFYRKNHLALLKDRFLKKMILKIAKPRCLFFFTL